MKKIILVTCYVLLVTLLTTPVLAQDATPSDSVRDKVRKTIENLTKRPKAVVGSLDSVSDSTLKIKTENLPDGGQGAKFVLVATSDKTTYSKTTKGKAVEVKFADLTIGDFVAALGYKNGNDIIDARRVLAYDEAPFPKKQAAYGEVKTNKKGVLTVKHPKTGEAWTVETSAKTKITKKVDGKMEEVKAAEIEEGDRIVAVGTLNTKKEKTLVATRVHVIPGKAVGLDNPKRTPRPDASPLPTPKVSLKPSPTS